MTETGKRLTALDSFRGLTVAGMILVNTPGSGEHVWWPLEHAAWHGFTPADLVFPAFLCAMGMAFGLSFPRRIDAGFWTRVIRRSLLLIAIGWAWQMLARPNDLAHIRLPGVLPRLGLCYGLAAVLVVLTAGRNGEGKAALWIPVLLGISAAILLAYWAAMSAAPFTPEGNLAGRIDRALVGTNHMWRFGTDAAGNVVYDPEGLFSTLPALANVLFGVAAAVAWKCAPERGAMRIALAGAALVLLGLGLAPFFPVNKALWTSSYALLSAGLSGLLFATCALAMRSPAIRRAQWPFDVFGMNAILGYILSLLLVLAGMRLGFQAAAFEALAGLTGAPYLASFLYALAALLVTLALLIPFHRRGIHLRL